MAAPQFFTQRPSRSKPSKRFTLAEANSTLPLVIVEFWQFKSRNLLVPLTLRLWTRAALQGALLIAIILYWERNPAPFIYFQF